MNGCGSLLSLAPLLSNTRTSLHADTEGLFGGQSSQKKYPKNKCFPVHIIYTLLLLAHRLTKTCRPGLDVPELLCAPFSAEFSMV